MRAPLIFGDSFSEPTDIGTIDAFEPVLAPLLERIAETGTALGRSRVDVAAFCKGGLPPRMCHGLDDYVEARVHGAVKLSDAEAFVIDGSFAGTPAGERLVAAAERYGIAAEWLPGPQLPVAGVPAEAPGDLGSQRFCAGGTANLAVSALAATRICERLATTNQRRPQ